jgi:hypothetical protein
MVNSVRIPGRVLQIGERGCLPDPHARATDDLIVSAIRTVLSGKHSHYGAPSGSAELCA